MKAKKNFATKYVTLTFLGGTISYWRVRLEAP